MADYGTGMASIMAYKGFEIEEDNRKYREFLKSDQFRYAANALSEYETDEGGLTPAEVWQEVNMLLEYLKTVDSDDRDVMVTQLFNQEKRRLKCIERDDGVIRLDDDAMDRTLTSVFYCLALRLERTCKTQSENPHNDLIDAIVLKLNKIHHRILPFLHYVINQDGEKGEKKSRSEMRPLDPLAVNEDWEEKLSEIINHYSDRMWNYVKSSHQTAYNEFWKKLIQDEKLIALMAEDKCVKGDESFEFGVAYNAKAVFNIFGMLYGRGYFQQITGWKPLAEKVSEHYDGKTNNKVKAKAEYFKIEQRGTLNQFFGIPSDLLDIIRTYMEKSKQ